MTPAEKLTAAATKLRETAARVPQGTDDDQKDWAGRPWQAEECDRGCVCIVYQGDYTPDAEPQVPPIQYVADGESEEHAAWIALMHPGLAEPLAMLLEDQAKAYELFLETHTADVAERVVWHALTLARVINGVTP